MSSPPPVLAVESNGTGRTVGLRLRLGDRTLALDEQNPRRAPVRAKLAEAWLGVLDPHLSVIGRTRKELAIWLDGELLHVADDLAGRDAASPPAESGQGRPLTFETVDPWHDPVDGAALLDEVQATCSRFVVMASDSAASVALWTLHCWCIDALQYSPRLNVSAATKRAGKSTLLEVLSLLCPRAFAVASISGAALARVVEEHRPTLLLDEADAWLDEAEELRGIVNAGCRPNGAIIRCVGDDAEPRAFSCWGPVALAGIGRRKDTIADRSITVELRRKTATDRVEPLRLDRIGDELRPIRQRLARFAVDALPALRAADPELPPSVTNRLADVWRGPVALADLAGGHWPATSRRIATGIAAAADDAQDSLGVLLLADLRDLFGERDPESKITTEAVLAGLNGLAERPWPTLGKGRPMDARRLARLLEPFGIRSTTFRLGDATPKGYRRADFDDAFRRYLSEGGVPEPQHRNTLTDAWPGGSPRPATPASDVVDGIAPQGLSSKGCCGVADKNTPRGGVAQGDDPASEFDRLLGHGGAA